MRFNPHLFKSTQPFEPQPDAPPESTRLRDAFIQWQGLPGADPVAIPEGRMAVTLCLKFDDSAPQVDHFDYHAALGCPDFLLLMVRKQAQTEALARKALSLCPGLQHLDWKWHTEKYAGGHGNYLASSPFTLPGDLQAVLTARHTFGGAPVTTAFWEIEFCASYKGCTHQLPPHRNYGQAPMDDTPAARERSTAPVTMTWKLSTKGGVEIYFNRRPDDATLAPLRADRAWRWNNHTKCWWARHTPQTLAFAKAFVEGKASAATDTPAEIPAPPPVAQPTATPQQRPMRIIRFPGRTAIQPPPAQPESNIIAFPARPASQAVSFAEHLRRRMAGIVNETPQ